ncbi:hypothetical protein ACFC1T_09630 [Kitasatospora sp. NPDC056076]|uniref:hypothetical protein n=1 Tax=Kitasatospora sp. NPDC056076 TaxID=3345703 RepID=UPI0035D6766F
MSQFPTDDVIEAAALAAMEHAREGDHQQALQALAVPPGGSEAYWWSAQIVHLAGLAEERIGGNYGTRRTTVRELRSLHAVSFPPGADPAAAQAALDVCTRISYELYREDLAAVDLLIDAIGEQDRDLVMTCLVASAAAA